MSRNHPTIDPNIAAEIEACSYLSLRELREPKDNAVTLVLDEAIIGANATNLTLGDITLNEVRNIEVTRNSRAFELLWDQYVAYSVRNESFSLPGKDEEIASGHWLRIYRKSHFLDYLNKATWGDACHPGPVTHFGIICLNHVIDVASVKPPKIRLL